MENRKDYYFIVILFSLSFFIRFLLCDFPKYLIIQPDELIYYQLAENLAQNRGLLVYNLPNNYTNILYSLFLIPAFLFENREYQQHAVSFINAMLITSSIFPTYFLAKLFLNHQKHIYAVCLLSLIIPDLTYSVTFMSENLYLPLALWCFYFYVLFILKNKISIAFSIGLGLLTYFAYLCKTIAVFFILSLMIYYALPLSLTAVQNRLYKIKCFSISLIVFLFLFVFVKYFWFSNIENYYNYANPSESSFLFYVFAVVQGVFVFLTHCLLSSGFFPSLLTFSFYKKLPHSTQQAILFLTLLIVLTALTVASTIYWTEDFPHSSLRTLTRYVCYVWVPLWCFFFCVLEQKNKIIWHERLFYVFSCLFILMLFLFNGSYHKIPMDNTMLFILDLASPEFVLSFKMIIFILFFFLLLNRSLFFVGFISFIIIFYAINNFGLYYEYKNIFYAMTESEKEDITEVENFVRKNSNKIFLASNASWLDKNQSLLDTFVNYPNVATVDILSLLSSENKRLDANVLFPLWHHSIANNRYFYSLKKVDYFIFPSYMNGKTRKDYKLIQIKVKAVLKDAQVVLKNAHFEVYKNPHVEELPFIGLEPFDQYKEYPFLLDYPHHSFKKIFLHLF